MVFSRTRYARIVHALFREAPTRQSRIITVSRAEAARWGSARHLITVSNGADVSAAWFENEVWHVGQISLRDGRALMSPTRVVVDGYDVVDALLGRARHAFTGHFTPADAPPRVLVGQAA